MNSVTPTQAVGCVGNTIRVRSGKYLDLKNPQSDQFEFSDIAGALSKICRFGGQCSQFYSVAEHSFHCADVAFNDERPLEVMKAVLMHDAAEAFVGDCVRPMKILLRDFAAIEAQIQAVIAAKFGVDFDANADVISEIDNAMLFAERRVLFSKDGVLWSRQQEMRVLSPNIKMYGPREAEEHFTNIARILGLIP